MTVTDRHIARDYHVLSRDHPLKRPTPRRIILTTWRYPAGWQPRTTPLLIRFPDQYPRIQPAIYLPDHLSYTRGPVTHMFLSDRIDDKTGEWTRWCTHELPWTGDLDQFLTHIIQPSLNRPHATNPVQRA